MGFWWFFGLGWTHMSGGWVPVHGFLPAVLSSSVQWEQTDGEAPPSRSSSGVCLHRVCSQLLTDHVPG